MMRILLNLGCQDGERGDGEEDVCEDVEVWITSISVSSVVEHDPEVGEMLAVAGGEHGGGGADLTPSTGPAQLLVIPPHTLPHLVITMLNNYQ